MTDAHDVEPEAEPEPEPEPECSGDSRNEPERSDSLRTFGAVVQAFRKRAGLTQEQWAPLSGYAVSTCSAIEQGRRFPPYRFVENAEEHLDAFGALRDAARHLSRRPGLAAWFRQWAELERTARSLYTYECRVVPGLLQTEAYARTLIDSVPPLLAEDEVEHRVAVRAERQQALLNRSQPILLSFVIEQAVLERRTGGDQVTTELLDHLVDCAGMRNVELQIMPLVQPEHAGLDGMMMLMETAEHRWLGYAEGQETGHLIADEMALSRLHMRYAKLRSQALTPADSLSLLKRMRGAS